MMLVVERSIAEMSAQAPVRRRMSAEGRREQLLDVTAELVSERGFHGLSAELIAQRAGVTRAVIYQQFGDLGALFHTVIERECSRALAQVSATTLRDLSAGDPLELMLGSLDAYLRAVREHPARWRLVLMPPEGAPEELHTSIAAGRATILAQLIGAVRPALAGVVDAPDAELTARVLSAIADEYARLVLTDPAAYPIERLLRHAKWWLRDAEW